ncbi:hypothetical protein GCM10020295_42340 [Streptomyces cinereospinus]
MRCDGPEVSLPHAQASTTSTRIAVTVVDRRQETGIAVDAAEAVARAHGSRVHGFTGPTGRLARRHSSARKMGVGP